MSDNKDVLVPDVGGDEVEVIEVCVAVGDVVEAETSLITVESDKASMDIPAPFGGTISEILVAVGDKVGQDKLIMKMTSSDGASEATVEAAPEKAPEEVPAPAEKSAPTTESAPEAEREAAGEPQIIEVTVPDIGGDTDVEVIEILVSVGDSIEEEAGLITLETDKATMDVPAPQAGIIKELKIKVGDKVSQGALVLLLEVAGSAPKATPVVAAEKTDVPKAAAEPETQVAPGGNAPKSAPVPHHPSAGERGKAGKVHASPSVRRVAREFGVDLSLVKGSGPKNRVLKEDVQSYVKYELSRPKMNAGSSVGNGSGGLQVLAPPKVDFSKFGEVEEVPLTRIQKISGPTLHRNWVTIPHVTQFEDADITDLEAFRKAQNVVAEKKKLGFKITPLVFMIKAVADALQAYPVFNSSLSESGESLIMKKYFHVGIAVETPNGLVVPVVRDVDKKGIYALSAELMEISIKARDGKLKAADMQGSCFTISSLGGIGGTAFTPIVNAPDVAILGVSKSEMKPKWNGKDFEPRLILPLSLSYDHRVIDGAVAARFAVHLSNVLGDLRQMLL
ncbi:MAG: pyruvate dehydrogenase E2 component (dihydrolipoamide acetyltransferase) [Paraglaciecola sp.]|jgi:pyruvate dehydrogenase E2 component (dihydrolipoamide acetyltransferase)